MFSALEATIAARLSETRRLAALARALEDNSEAEARTLRGFAYVLLYGLMEYSVSQGLRFVLRTVSDSAIPYHELTHELYAVALDAEFTSLAFVGGERKWSKRSELLNAQHSGAACNIKDDILDDQLKNVRISTLTSIFRMFGISGPVVPTLNLTGYINDVADRRNEIAHGEFSAADVGGRKTDEDLEKALAAISSTIAYILQRLQEYCEQRGFVREPLN